MTGAGARPDLSLYLIADVTSCRTAGRSVVKTAAAAARGGVTAVQLRDKRARGGELLDTVRRVAEVLPPRIPLIVNDRVDVYLAARLAGIRVAGVHIGQSDLPVPVTRTMIGPDALLGLSAATADQLAAANRAPVDYVGIGALHATDTKQDAPPPLGTDGFRRLAGLCRRPVVAIGGISADDLPGLRTAGAAGAAVAAAVCRAPDPYRAATRLAAAWREAA
ncbi:thiamine-phosphate synthase [Actinocatenispora thailandica]|uniref:Thiamine-phosphate synthase n=1 Tax=Actinocatenispora thailandica TaxID=227318 RepID=A0A7R7DQ79_9ACTN|nr:thiamine phosphate synthase [Actinocatenispora thailandica]BCJ35671.1 thiamine-phosphate synthase [Actinocatenispora thailandica]